MKLRWLIPLAILIPLRALALFGDTPGRMRLTVQSSAASQNASSFHFLTERLESVCFRSS